MTMRNYRHWIVGTAMALCGVAVARVLAPLASTHYAAACRLAGVLLSMMGLMVIAVGTRRKYLPAGSGRPTPTPGPHEADAAPPGRNL